MFIVGDKYKVRRILTPCFAQFKYVPHNTWNGLMLALINMEKSILSILWKWLKLMIVQNKRGRFRSQTLGLLHWCKAAQTDAKWLCGELSFTLKLINKTVLFLATWTFFWISHLSVIWTDTENKVPFYLFNFFLIFNGRYLVMLGKFYLNKVLPNLQIRGVCV